MQKHTIAVLVENQFGVLCRVAGLFSARGFNIDSLTVGPTQDPLVSRMTVVARGDERVVQQIARQLDKLIDVIRVDILAPQDTTDRELVMIKVASDASNRNDMMQVVISDFTLIKTSSRSIESCAVKISIAITSISLSSWRTTC